jgi:hypothetical protein
MGEDDLKETSMSEANKANTVAFHKKAVFEGDVENAFRLYAGGGYRQHNPLIEDGMGASASSSPGSSPIVRTRTARSSAFSRTAITSSSTAIGAACRTVRAVKPSWTSTGQKMVRWSSTGM